MVEMDYSLKNIISTLKEMGLELQWLFADGFTNPVVLVIISFMIAVYGYFADFRIHGDLNSAIGTILGPISVLLFIALVAWIVKYSNSTVAYGADRCLRAKDVYMTRMRFSAHIKTLRGFIRSEVGWDIPDDFILRTLGENQKFSKGMYHDEDPPRNLEHVFRAISLHIYDELLKDKAHLSAYVDRVKKTLADDSQIPALRKMVAELFMEVPPWYRTSATTPRQRGVSLYLEEHSAVLRVLFPILTFLVAMVGLSLSIALNFFK